MSDEAVHDPAFVEEPEPAKPQEWRFATGLLYVEGLLHVVPVNSIVCFNRQVNYMGDRFRVVVQLIWKSSVTVGFKDEEEYQSFLSNYVAHRAEFK